MKSGAFHLTQIDLNFADLPDLTFDLTQLTQIDESYCATSLFSIVFMLCNARCMNVETGLKSFFFEPGVAIVFWWAEMGDFRASRCD